MSKSIVTDYSEICFFCGRQAEGEHHLIFGTAGRELSEKDGLKVPVCNNCHNMGEPLKECMIILWRRSCQRCWGRQSMRRRSVPGSSSGRDTENLICRRR